MVNKVAIIGCGAILNRHVSAVKENSNFELVAVCDTQKSVADSKSKKYGCSVFYEIADCIDKSSANFYVIATPNSMHYEQAKLCIESGKDVLVEKPACLDYREVEDLGRLASKHGVNAYCVLQVRLNNSVSVVKKCLDAGLLGKIRGACLVQRWQRPVEYFSGWRAIPEIGGGTLHEVGIHYIDIMQYILGSPDVPFSKVYNTKHVESEIEDTVYSILDFGDFGGTLEVTISSEPHNLECSLSILGSNGYIKLGGKALNIVESYNFLSHGAKKKFEHTINEYENVSYIEPNNYGSYLGSCPNHGDLYKNLSSFGIERAIPALRIIEDIYRTTGRKY